MLQSAIGYCQAAGLTVQAGNSSRGLALTIPGASYALTDDGKRAEFRIGTSQLPAATGDGTLFGYRRGAAGQIEVDPPAAEAVKQAFARASGNEPA